MGQFFKSISIALHNIRANPLHTFLSTLGIIIGVAAMVGILALGDGLEQTGREQIANTTSLNIISVNSLRTKTVDDIRIVIENRPRFDLDEVRDFRTSIKEQAILEFTDTKTGEIVYNDSTTGVYVQGTMELGLKFSLDSTKLGRFISEEDILTSKRVVVLSEDVAYDLSDNLETFLGKEVHIQGENFTVIGILNESQSSSKKAFIPISVYDKNGDQYPQIVLKATKAEEIPNIEEKIKQWLDDSFAEGNEAFYVSTNRARVEQFSQGILLFKLIMGAITGISVLVGGIGVMNVLLISVTERTKEIGIRKATGAKKKDIVLQFMAESVTISFVGCILGWILGIVGIFLFVPIVNSFTEIGEFRAAIGLGTVISILVISLIVGIVFGTYPAWRAAQLTPVDAIRHE